MTFDEAVRLIEGASDFGDLAAAGVAPERAYRMLVKLVHPDVAPAGRGASATAAFARLGSLREKWTLVAAGDIANLYAVHGGAALLKLPRLPVDNDLLAAEARALGTLQRDGDPKHRAYAPRLIETFTHEDPATGVRRTANVVARQRGFVSLAAVARAYPHGVDPRDAAWMWRRLLTGLGWAHRAGIVHGAVLPEHVLIHPGEHGLVLVDWCYSVAPGGRIPALVAAHRDSYPPEVIARQPPSEATDIYLATTMMRALIGPALPAALRRFADGCLYAAPRMRPQDAWRLLAELDELLEHLFGPRRFREFALPA